MNLTAIHFRNGDIEFGYIEMKAFTRPELPAEGAAQTIGVSSSWRRT